jgi:hypothetical protein
MQIVLRTLLLLLFFTLPASSLTSQTAANNNDGSIFTISVQAPTAAKDVQVRYFLTDESGARWSSTAATVKEDKILINADTTGRAAKGFSAIAYAAGCQFVTFKADDLSTSSHQGEFQCLKLPTVELRGTVPSSQRQHQLDLESMYVVQWAGKFFGVPGISISPLSVTKNAVQADGSFSMELPDFTADPLWNTMANNATLMFFLVDHATGHRIATLRAPAALARNGDLKVAATYPDVAFSIRPNQTAKAMKPVQ